MVPPHAHDTAVEGFYVLAGTYRMTVSGTTHLVEPGGFVLVPRGASHRFEVVAGEPARAAVLFAPAGFESVFRAMPEIFGTRGEPGPLWTAANSDAGTRLLDHDLIGPPAVLVASGESGQLAGPSVTGTTVRVALRHDPVPGTRWLVEPDTAVWVLAGCYVFGGPQGACALRAGEFTTLGRGVRARAMANGSRALHVRTGEPPA
jgi:hypothetical protein